jgi:hypothetical protein
MLMWVRWSHPASTPRVKRRRVLGAGELPAQESHNGHDYQAARNVRPRPGKPSGQCEAPAAKRYFGSAVRRYRLIAGRRGRNRGSPGCQGENDTRCGAEAEYKSIADYQASKASSRRRRAIAGAQDGRQTVKMILGESAFSGLGSCKQWLCTPTPAAASAASLQRDFPLRLKLTEANFEPAIAGRDAETRACPSF